MDVTDRRESDKQPTAIAFSVVMWVWFWYNLGDNKVKATDWLYCMTKKQKREVTQSNV